MWTEASKKTEVKSKRKKRRKKRMTKDHDR